MAGEIEAKSENGIRWLRLIGHGERNAMTPHMMRRLGEEFRAVPADVRVIVISGAGKGWFCGGGHVGNLEELTLEQTRAICRDFIEFHRALRRVEIPVIAKVDGHVAANGVALVAACDLAIAAKNVEFAMPEINVGLIPLLATVVLVRHIAPKTAFELAYFGRRFSAEAAKSYGLLNQVVEDAAALDAQVENWTTELAGRSRAALATGRAAFIAMMYEGIDRDMELAAGNLTSLFMSEEVRAALRTTGGHAFADRAAGKH
jgi:enoyl-CoA hydratase/carnithine racemase